MWGVEEGLKGSFLIIFLIACNSTIQRTRDPLRGMRGKLYYSKFFGDEKHSNQSPNRTTVGISSK